MNDLASLKACKDAVTKYQEIATKNEGIASNNALISAQAAKANSEWNARRLAREKSITDWDNDKAATKIRWCALRESMGCGACGTNADCIGDYEHASDNRCGILNWGCENWCRRKDYLCESEALKEVTARRGARPELFNEQEPRDNFGIYAHADQIQNTTTIQCCANVMNVANATDVAQTCDQKIQSLLDKSPSMKIEKKTSADNKKRNQIIVVIVILIIACISISISSSIVFSDE